MAIFTRFLFIVFFLHSIQGYTQPAASCSACEASIVSKEITALHADAKKNIVFKCPIAFHTLEVCYKWGVADAQGKLLVKPLWDSIGTINNDLVAIFQYIPQRKKAPLKAGLISLQQKTVLPLSYRSIRVIAGTYYRVDTGKGFQLWKAGKGFFSSFLYDSIVKTPTRILLYTEGFCHRLDSTAQQIEQGPYREWQTNDNRRTYPTFYDTVYIYRNGAAALTPLLVDSIVASSKVDELILYRNSSRIPFRLVSLPTKTNDEINLIHPQALTTLLDSTLIKIKNRSKADSLVLVNNWYLYRRNNMWGYGDTLGNIGIGAQYEALRYKYNNRLAMKYKGKWGFLDDRENMIAQPYYDEVGDFIYTGAWVKQGVRYNFIGLNGKILNSNWYDQITPTVGNNYLVVLKGKTGLVSKEGREIISTRYLQVLDFGGGSCLTQTEDGKWFLMNYSEYRISNDPYSSVQYLTKSKVYVLKK
jgi:WG containing repeat